MPRRMILALGLLAAALIHGGPPLRAAEAPHETRATQPAHEAAGEEQPDVLKPEPSLAIWTAIVFGLLLVILGKYAWKPLLEAMHQREHHLEQTLQDTERARGESERMLAEHRKQMEQAAEQVRALLDEARRNAQTTADEIVKKAQAEAEASRKRAEREIGNARDQALAEIWTKTADLAVSVAGRVLARDLTPEDHHRLVQVALNELPAGPPATNGRGGHTA
jgi:F-type H+-transporting ATPase subunit b